MIDQISKNNLQTSKISFMINYIDSHAAYHYHVNKYSHHKQQKFALVSQISKFSRMLSEFYE